jgi:hypothetical protein
LHVLLCAAVVAFAPLIAHEVVSEPPFASEELLLLVNSSFCQHHFLVLPIEISCLLKRTSYLN